MTTRRLRIARCAILATVLVLLLDLGGSLYEHLVIDTAWLDNPRLIQLAAGGVDRKRFWIPIHGALTLAFFVAILVSFPDRAARYRVLIGAGSYAAMRVWTFVYFVPFALEMESLDTATLPPAVREAAREWITLSLLRFPLVLGAAVACWLAARHLDARSSRRAALDPPGARGEG